MVCRYICTQKLSHKLKVPNVHLFKFPFIYYVIEKSFDSVEEY